VKYDGHRMLVIGENERVRLLSRNGSDWARRYPLIAEDALKNRQKHLVIDGEADILGVDGISDFNALLAGGRFKASCCRVGLGQGIVRFEQSAFTRMFATAHTSETPFTNRAMLT
jgi:ATP dependent DNA ligase domain